MYADGAGILPVTKSTLTRPIGANRTVSTFDRDAFEQTWGHSVGQKSNSMRVKWRDLEHLKHISKKKSLLINKPAEESMEENETSHVCHSQRPH